jgi:type-F conjugative transfer system pilin assembly protein TrbC
MPKASLIELSEQSQKYNATLVLRGIHEDSFLKTKDKILKINPNGLLLDINPELFKQYDIQRVPTFVLVKNGKEINRLAGNVTLEFAHKKLMEQQ